MISRHLSFLLQTIRCLNLKAALFMCVFFILIQFNVFSQELTQQVFARIRWPKDSITGIREKIYFYDSITRRQIAVVDLAEVNPYGRLNEKIVDSILEYRTPIYELASPKSKVDSFRLVSTNYFPEGVDIDPFQLSSQYSFSRESQNFIAVLYNLTTWNKHHQNISTHTTALIFNSRGEMVYRCSHLDVNAWNPLITDDGRFLFFLMGGPESESVRPYIPRGFQVFDTMRNRKIYQDSIGSDMVASLIDGKLFFVPNAYTYNQHEYRVFDFYKNIVYNKSFKSTESGGLFEKNINYLKLKDRQTKEVKIIYYAKEFIESKILDK